MAAKSNKKYSGFTFRAWNGEKFVKVPGGSGTGGGKGNPGGGAEIRGCNCDSPAQDALYGRGLRVFNVGAWKSQPSMEKVKCTVCSRTTMRGGL